MKHLLKYKLLYLCVASLLCSVQMQAQRASEKPLSAFYSAELKKKMDARTTQPQSQTTKRASEKSLDAFFTPEMKTRMAARTPRPAATVTVKRASQKPLSAFYTKELKARISSKPNAFSPAASAPLNK